VLSLKQRSPLAIKRLGRRAYTPVGQATAGFRLMPTFILAGAQRCGTTSLYRALLTHPAVLSAAYHKGVNYFDVNYERGMDWYRGHFPLNLTGALRTRGTDESPVTFDASGYYMYHPLAAGRIGRDLPGIKVLVLLRDPVERAYSAYKHEYRRGFETESFERALQIEDERVQPELERMVADPSYQSTSYRHHSYRRRGLYAEQMDRLAKAVGRDNLLAVESERFFEHPEEEYARVIRFLGLTPHQPDRFDRWNARPGSEMPVGARDFLMRAYGDQAPMLAPFFERPPTWALR
jgi:hypothetical protein